ncbi:MAG: two-component sensor histidine kinase [Saccharofermentans sp.]|nr:two-component sensor histidine kinase [Saccharofermentans sp.]
MRQKINLILSIIALVAIVTTSIGITLVYYNLFQNQVRADLKQNARLLVESEVFQNAYQKGYEHAPSLANLSPGNLRITWIDADGTVLFDNDTNVSGLANHLDRPEIRQAFDSGEGESTRRSDTMNMNTFYYALLLENGTVLRVSTQARTIFSVLFNALPVILVIVAVTLIACVLIGHLLTKQLMKPLEVMAEHLDDASEPAYKELEPFARKIRSQHENILAAAKSRQDFTANVSHELKTPITAISGYAELIENNMVAKEDEAHVARQIRHNADRLHSLVNDIIKLSELDHLDRGESFETIDLFEVAKECVNDMKTAADKKQVKLTCKGSSAGVIADRALIREMIDNLVQNGIRYNKEKGSCEVYVTIQNARPILTVKDTGIGIPQDQLDRVFERFYRVDKSRSRETGGTGLGLAIVKHIVELHSAEIAINSTLGEGTTVTVSFWATAR